MSEFVIKGLRYTAVIKAKVFTIIYLFFLRTFVKVAFNNQFGSVFRSGSNPSYFSRRLHRVSDVYTAHVTNFLNYPTDYFFFPHPGLMPHEYHLLAIN